MKPLSFIIILSCFALIANAQTVTLSVTQPDPLEAELPTTTFDILLGDTLTIGEGLDITGGTPPYLIEWTNSVNEEDTICKLLSVTPSDTINYTCTVIDSTGCSLSQFISVNVIFPLSIEISKNDISCYGANNGSISLNISGGAQPYSTAWINDATSNEINSLAPGDYGVTITDAFDQKIDTIVSIIESPQITSSVNQTICANQTYNFNGKELNFTGEYVDTLMTSGGCDSIVTLNLLVNETYASTLSETICEGSTIIFGNKELTQTGTYIDSLQSITGCDSIITLNLTVNRIYLSSVDAEICYGETYSFQGLELNATGQYTDSLTSVSGCDSLIVCNLKVNDLPEKPIVSINGDTLTSSDAENYQWFQNNELLNGQTDQTLVITKTGNYEVEISNEFGCSNQSEIYSVIYSAIAEFSSPDFNFKVYPNPNNGLFTVELETTKAEPADLRLYSVDGKLILQKTIEGKSGLQSIPFGKNSLIKGVYTLQIQEGLNTIHQKLIIN